MFSANLPDKISRSEKGQVYWGRSHIDGLPFRSQVPPGLKTEEEFEAHSEVVSDARYGMFDTAETSERFPKGSNSGRTYQEVLEGIVSGAFTLLYREHIIDNAVSPPKMYVYVEWTENYRQFKGLDRPMLSSNKEESDGNTRLL